MKNNYTLEKIIKKLIKEYKGVINLANVIDALKKQGYDVVFFHTEEGDKIAELYDMTSTLEKVNAITYAGTKNIVFVNNDLHSQDKLYLLLHELGHVLLKHVGHGDTDRKNKCLMEIEADAFTYNILHYKKPQYWQWFVVAFCALTLSVCGVKYMYGNQPQENLPVITPNPPVLAAPVTTVRPEENTNSENMSDIVYITKTGKTYHRETCRYAKDKNCTALSRAEAEKNYTPCKVCNP